MRLIYFIFSLCVCLVASVKLTGNEIKHYREIARRMFYHAYDGYMKYAFPYDELRPLTCDGHDTWGSYSLTLIDALDTLAIMGNATEFRKVAQIVLDRADFDIDINVSVFETNIRIVGGLVSAHLMAKRMGMELEDGWPCKGPLLSLAETVAKKLLPAFHTKTGMPYGTVNLAHGVPYGETPITCTAGVGTYLVEFGALSRLTGDPIYEKAALRAMLAVWRQRSSLDLLGNHIDVMTGRWTALDAGIGAGVDSYFEYLVKGAALLQRPELMQIFNTARVSIDKHLRHDDWHLWVTMTRGHVTMPIFQSLEAFWPGVLTLAGDVESAQKTLFNYHQVWKQYGFTPESYNIPQGEAASKREGYPLRPELIESIMYMYRATGDHTYLNMGADILLSIEHSAKTSCGYATVKNVRNHQLENRMESFFLAETTKYLYLLFADDHWMHNNGPHGTLWTNGNRRCVIDAGGYIFNSEAHPVDPGALACCSPSPAEANQEELWMGLEPAEVAELILNPSKKLDYGIHRHNLHKDIFIERGDLKFKTRKELSMKNSKNNIQSEVNDLKKEMSNNIEDIMENVDISEENEIESPKLGAEKDIISEKLEESKSSKKSDKMPVYFEESSLEDIKQKVDEVVNEYYRKNRYAGNQLSKPKIINLSKKDDSRKKSDAVKKFEPSYDGGQKTLENVEGKIITSTKTQISEENKELEPDSNLTSPEKTNNENLSPGAEKKDSTVTLNLPRFGAILATPGENNSGRGEATPIGENSGISTSVSSSKYSNPSISDTPGAKIVQELLQPILKKNPRSIQVPGPCLRDQLEFDLEEYSNFTRSASYTLLSCSHPTLSDLLSYKGQIIET